MDGVEKAMCISLSNMSRRSEAGPAEYHEKGFGKKSVCHVCARDTREDTVEGMEDWENEDEKG